MRRDRDGTGLHRVLSQLDDLLDAVEREPETMRAMIVLTFETPAVLENFAGWFDRLIADYEAELVDHLAAGQADGLVRSDLDPAREAEIFVSYAIGLCFRSALRRDGYDFVGEIKAWRARLARRYCLTPFGVGIFRGSASRVLARVKSLSLRCRPPRKYRGLCQDLTLLRVRSV